MANSRKILLKLNWKVGVFFIYIYIVILLQGSICFPDISSNKSCLNRKNKHGIAETTRFCCVDEQGKELKKEKKKSWISWKSAFAYAMWLSHCCLQSRALTQCSDIAGSPNWVDLMCFAENTGENLERCATVSMNQFRSSFLFIAQCPNQTLGLKVLWFYQCKEVKIIIYEAFSGIFITRY